MKRPFLGADSALSFLGSLFDAFQLSYLSSRNLCVDSFSVRLYSGDYNLDGFPDVLVSTVTSRTALALSPLFDMKIVFLVIYHAYLIVGVVGVKLLKSVACADDVGCSQGTIFALN